jgi:hypothetical protein
MITESLQNLQSESRRKKENEHQLIYFRIAVMKFSSKDLIHGLTRLGVSYMVVADHKKHTLPLPQLS